MIVTRKKELEQRRSIRALCRIRHSSNGGVCVLRAPRHASVDDPGVQRAAFVSSVYSFKSDLNRTHNPAEFRLRRPSALVSRPALYDHRARSSDVRINATSQRHRFAIPLKWFYVALNAT